jgi:integrase
MAKPNLRLVTPGTEIRTVTPTRPPNAELRTREHLTADEVDKLIEAAKANRYGHRDGLMVLMAYRHGLRAAEVVDLRWKQVDFKTAVLHVRSAKNGTPATHPLSGREMRELRPSAGKPWLALCVRFGAWRTAMGSGLFSPGRAGSCGG